MIYILALIFLAFIFLQIKIAGLVTFMIIFCYILIFAY